MQHHRARQLEKKILLGDRLEADRHNFGAFAIGFLHDLDFLLRTKAEDQMRAALNQSCHHALVEKFRLFPGRRRHGLNLPELDIAVSVGCHAASLALLNVRASALARPLVRHGINHDHRHAFRFESADGFDIAFR